MNIVEMNIEECVNLEYDICPIVHHLLTLNF